jgi:hypothetical protein
LLLFATFALKSFHVVARWTNIWHKLPYLIHKINKSRVFKSFVIQFGGSILHKIKLRFNFLFSVSIFLAFTFPLFPEIKLTCKNICESYYVILIDLF